MILALFLLVVNYNILAQKDWIHYSPYTDSIVGVATYNALEYFENKPQNEIIVAVLDNGCQLQHVGLQQAMWVNKDEIPENGIDDDNNGYIDDINGWNFLGNKNGKSYKNDNDCLTRQFKNFYEKYKALDSAKSMQIDSVGYKEYLYLKHKFDEKLTSLKEEYEWMSMYLYRYMQADTIIREFLHDSVYSIPDLDSLIPDGVQGFDYGAKSFLQRMHVNGITLAILKDYEKRLIEKITIRYSLEYNERNKIVGDDTDNLQDNVYGNNNIDARGPYHGTGVAGAIVGLHDSIPLIGVAAQNVKIMALRVVPNGDERDKDVALAIKYAVNNGAKIINCSFGKEYSLHPEFVKEALLEAQANDVLIVKSAGNDGMNIDSINYYPLDCYIDTCLNNVITVGASGMYDTPKLIAGFSNYGKNNVDVFAPGVDVFTTVLNDKYDISSGTSMAAPVVSGVAAMLWSYFPDLSAKEIKQVLIKSVYKPKSSVFVPQRHYYAEMSDMCASGGVVNLYNAILMVEKMRNNY